VGVSAGNRRHYPAKAQKIMSLMSLLRQIACWEFLVAREDSAVQQCKKTQATAGRYVCLIQGSLEATCLRGPFFFFAPFALTVDLNHRLARGFQSL
jgi:hypothetical protein